MINYMCAFKQKACLFVIICVVGSKNLFCSQAPSINEFFQSPSRSAATLNDLLIKAVKKDSGIRVSSLLKSGADVNAVDNNGKTALMCAVHLGHFDIAKLLLQNNANVTLAVKESKTTALKLAVESKKQNLVDLLLEAYAQANVDINADDQGFGALMIAAAVGDEGIARSLLNAGVNTSSVNSSSSALMLSIALRSHRAVKLLLRLGVDVNAHNAFRFTALMSAVISQDPEFVKLLLDARADVNAVNSRGETPLILAAKLKKSTSDIPVDPNPIIIDFKDPKQIVELLLDRQADLTIEDRRGLTAFMNAAKLGNFEILELLLKRGASVNAVNSGGLTPLMVAASSVENFEASSKFLLKNGANIDIVDEYGRNFIDHVFSNVRSLRNVGTLNRQQPREVKYDDVKEACRQLVYQDNPAPLRSLMN